VGAWVGGDRLATQQGLMIGFGIGHLACTLIAAHGMHLAERRPASVA
jgi:hypothetical protein